MSGWRIKPHASELHLPITRQFSIAPLLILLVASAGLVVKCDTTVQAEGQIAAIAGDNAAEAIAAIIRGAKASGGGRGATIFSGVRLLIGATGAFGQLQDAMNTIWEVTPKPRRFWVDILRSACCRL